MPVYINVSMKEVKERTVKERQTAGSVRNSHER